MKVVTNNVPRDIVYDFQLTLKEREQFDYLNWDKIDAGSDSASFFRYKGELYFLGDFMRWNSPDPEEMHQWDGYSSDSHFSGMLVRYVGDDQVVVAWYSC